MEFTFPLHLLKIAKSEIKIVHLILHFTEGSFRSIGKLLAVSLEKCEICAILISFIAVFSGALSILDQK